MIRRVIITAAVTPALLGAAATGASAATLAFDRACVNSMQDFGIGGAGFTPNSIVRGQAAYGVSKVFAVDAAGNFAGTLQVPQLILTDPRSEQPLTVTVQDAPSARPLVTGTILATIPRLALLPLVIDARRKMTVRIRGLRPGLPAYAHVRMRGRWVRTLPLGTPQGPCGTLNAKSAVLRNLRFRARTAEAYVQVDQSAAPNIIARPAGWARVVLRRPVGYAFFRYRAHVVRNGFHDVAVAPPTS